jgi:hypothetical protein
MILVIYIVNVQLTVVQMLYLQHKVLVLCLFLLEVLEV